MNPTLSLSYIYEHRGSAILSLDFGMRSSDRPATTDREHSLFKLSLIHSSAYIISAEQMRPASLVLPEHSTKLDDAGKAIETSAAFFLFSLLIYFVF